MRVPESARQLKRSFHKVSFYGSLVSYTTDTKHQRLLLVVKFKLIIKRNWRQRMTYEAIALCRVSTPEQRLNNSLNRQEESVNNAADLLGVTIVKTWSGDASSKVGKNVKRKDLNEAFIFCKTNRRVKYLIVDEVDRFMRSTGEMFYWMTKFQQEAGVQVYFASNPDLNTDDSKARLLLSLDSFKAEGSNEERQHKSVNGHKKAVREGRYTFPPKPGYVKGIEPGVHIPHSIIFKPLKTALTNVASGLQTPQEALKWLNNSDFTKAHAPWKIDKFSKLAVDPYYAGIIKVGRQVNESNLVGKHEPMLTIEEHEELVKIFTGRAKPRGEKKHYNPEMPMNKLLLCEDCGEETKFTGSRKSGSHKRKKINYYYKYYCRGCGRSYHRDELHKLISDKLNSIRLKESEQTDLTAALENVWKQKQKDKLRSIKTLESRLNELRERKDKLVLELMSADADIKEDFKDVINKTKQDITALENEISNSSELDEDLKSFIKFGLKYTDKLAEDWWVLDYEEKVRCQELLFSGGITFNSQKKVGTINLSPIYTLKPNKKDLSFTEKSLLVELAGNAPASSG